MNSFLRLCVLGSTHSSFFICSCNFQPFQMLFPFQIIFWIYSSSSLSFLINFRCLIGGGFSNQARNRGEIIYWTNNITVLRGLTVQDSKYIFDQLYYSIKWKETHIRKNTHTVIIGPTTKPIILRYEAGVNLVARTHPLRANYSLFGYIFLFFLTYVTHAIKIDTTR